MIIISAYNIKSVSQDNHRNQKICQHNNQVYLHNFQHNYPFHLTNDQNTHNFQNSQSLPNF